MIDFDSINFNVKLKKLKTSFTFFIYFVLLFVFKFNSMTVQANEYTKIKLYRKLLMKSTVYIITIIVTGEKKKRCKIDNILSCFCLWFYTTFDVFAHSRKFGFILLLYHRLPKIVIYFRKTWHILNCLETEFIFFAQRPRLDKAENWRKYVLSVLFI